MKMKTKTFLDETLELLDSSDMAVSDIASGAGVGERWLYKLKGRKAKDPSLILTDKVNRYLRFISVSKKVVSGSGDKPAVPTEQVVPESEGETRVALTRSSSLCNNNNNASADAISRASACEPSAT